MSGWIAHWFFALTGARAESGAVYGFLSGAGSDLGEVTLVGGLLAIYRKHTCHTRWCWRFGRHDFTDEVTGVVYRLCRKCHPMHSGAAPTRHHIALIHERNLGGQHEPQD